MVPPDNNLSGGTVLPDNHIYSKKGEHGYYYLRNTLPMPDKRPIRPIYLDFFIYLDDNYLFFATFESCRVDALKVRRNFILK